MFHTQQVAGPLAPGQYGPLQVSGPQSYYPMQTSGSTDIFTQMMPMLMMLLMFALIVPMFKGVSA